MKDIEFIKKCKLIHGNKYDYSLVNYINNKTKIEIICHTHGIFKQLPDDHLSGHGCKKCAYESKLEIKRQNFHKIFIEKSKEIFNNRYSYDGVDYVAMNKKVIITCPIHGNFKQQPKYHLKGNGCITCDRIYKTGELFIERSNKIHNQKYDYTQSIYSGSKDMIKIICITHGMFKQRPNDHLNGHGCPKCCNENNGLLKRNKSAINYINKANIIHNNKYDYNLLNYVDSNHKVKIVCPIHGEFAQYPQEHLRGYGCSKCKSSKGELEIIRILEKYSINYEHQKKFDGCENKRKLSFDFFLEDINTCIEYDGEQHIKQKEFFGGNVGLELTQKRDNIKTKFCQDNGIKLLRIPHTEIDIETTLLNDLSISIF